MCEQNKLSEFPVEIVRRIIAVTEKELFGFKIKEVSKNPSEDSDFIDYGEMDSIDHSFIAI